MYKNEKLEVIKAALKLKEYRLIALSGGNVSIRTPEGHFLVTPSGMSYETMVPSDIVVLDINGNIIEGKRKISVDIEAILYIFKNMPEVKAVIHTHQVYASAVGLVMDELPAAVTTLPNACLGPVTVAPFSSAASIEMGITAVKYMNNKRAVILKNHGVVAVGGTLKEALYSAIYLEDAAKTYIMAKIIGSPAILTEEQIEEAVKKFEPAAYGQQ
ncbi:MAG: class II aldolase/adducin family protein [Actinobacteria bacterium]|nr:class II aldolase/adducin family protein [Actinomycetota bacterium]